MRRAQIVAVAAALPLLLAACGGGGSDPGTDTTASGGGGTGSGRNGDRSGGGDVEGLLERLHELRELEQGQFLERVEQILSGQLCHGGGPS